MENTRQLASPNVWLVKVASTSIVKLDQLLLEEERESPLDADEPVWIG